MRPAALPGDWAELSLVEAAKKLRNGTLTAQALVAACQQRIARLEPRTQAWVSLDSTATDVAAACDHDLRAGQHLGPLQGLPLGVKDLFDVAGWPTRSGSTLSSPAPAVRDAAMVATLRQAGAIVLGKTVTTEWACFDPAPTLNPWHADCTPGGSSSGSAAAVANGMCLAALGSQTGGSITRPASYCGVCGLKPTWNRWSLEGVTPVAFHLDHPGLLARHVADLALLAAVVDGDSARAASVLEGRSPGQHHPPRLLWLKEFFWEEADDDVRQLTARAVARLTAQGATIVPARLPDTWTGVVASHRTIMAVEAAAVHETRFPAQRAQFGRHVSQLLDEGLAARGVDLARALAHQRRWRAAWAATATDFEALVLPATPTTAPRRRDTTGDPRFNSPWSLAGLPVVNIPCGLDPEGLPAGLQLVGSWGDDARLLDVAAWCERVLAFGDRPPGLAAN